MSLLSRAIIPRQHFGAGRTLELLLGGGVDHVDTAPVYGDSELRIGAWMPEHRDRFFLATKTEERTRSAAPPFT